MTSFELDDLCEDPISKEGHFLTILTLGLQHTNLVGEHNLTCNNIPKQGNKARVESSI